MMYLGSCYSFFRVNFLSVFLYVPPVNPSLPLSLTSFLFFLLPAPPPHPYSFSWVIPTIISFLSSFLFPLTEVYALLFKHPFLFFPSFFASWFLLSYYPFLSFLLNLSSDSYLCSSFQSSPPFFPPFSVFWFLIMSFFSIIPSYFSFFLKIPSFLFSFLCSLNLFCPSSKIPAFFYFFTCLLIPSSLSYFLILFALLCCPPFPASWLPSCTSFPFVCPPSPASYHMYSLKRFHPFFFVFLYSWPPVLEFWNNLCGLGTE